AKKWTSCIVGHLEVVGRKPEEWDPYKNASTGYGSNKYFSTLIKHIRNAVCHGNIFVKSDASDISDIVLLSSTTSSFEKYKKNKDIKCLEYDCVSMTPDDLHAVLKHWIGLCQKFRPTPE
ncbi:unnamed protein product, partial [Laminaria digitata]